MNLDQALTNPEVQIFGLVRDAEGRPKIDDPSTLHPAQKVMMTPEERAEFGVTFTEEDQAVLDSMQRIEA